MKSTLIWVAVALAAMLLCLDDFDFPGDRVYGAECSDLYTIVDTEIDQDGNTVFSIYVNEIGGSDSECLRFGRCVYDLIGSSAQMGAVEIVNFFDYWIPSQWQWIDSTRAAVLANEIDLEEYSWLSSYVWEVDHGD
jgi:hypothetical protein